MKHGLQIFWWVIASLYVLAVSLSAAALGEYMRKSGLSWDICLLTYFAIFTTVGMLPVIRIADKLCGRPKK